ncbi:cob(I)yrinic acid a,c-diamide adenosyltransferase [Kribbella sp. NBC_01245]|uniref:cob(I)yrinic acid a,c-diamide adenosyltransferase n=1 Tax=Kribbella sp. NBC_01245 TaxID=2903578 RepID=UPI002E27D0D1|nr:cob(I)yrinic acid a,c-diamide adenosyltransferase [Kribbella sp. NBC_01245]
MAVNLTRIYTRTGDAGETRLGDMSKTTKTDPRLAAYGEVDEANSSIGVAIAAGHLNSAIVVLLTKIQNDLFDVGADLCTPIVPNPEYPPLRITQEYVDRLEGWCDEYNNRLTKLRSFVLPGGSEGAAYLNVARCVVRRAERAGWVAVEAHGPAINLLAITYLNRLSDLLFILGRVANLSSGGDVLWIPGGSATAEPGK